MRTTLSQYSAKARTAIREEASRAGVSENRVIANADALFSGQCAIYRDPIFPVVPVRHFCFSFIGRDISRGSK